MFFYPGTPRQSESDNSIASSSPSPSPGSTTGVNFSPTSPDSGFETPPPQSSQILQTTPPHITSQIPKTTPLTNTLPQATSTPNNSRDTSVGPVVKNQPQSGSKSNQMPHLRLPSPSPRSQQQGFKKDNSTSQQAASRCDGVETPKSSRTNISADHEESSSSKSPSHENKSKELYPNQQKRIFSKNENEATSHHQSQTTKSPSQSAPTSHADSGSPTKSPPKGKPPDPQYQDPEQPVIDPLKSHADPHQRMQIPPASSSAGSFGYRSLSSQADEDIIEVLLKKAT